MTRSCTAVLGLSFPTSAKQRISWALMDGVKGVLTMYRPGHAILAMAALHASRPTQGMAKAIPLHVADSPKPICQRISSWLHRQTARRPCGERTVASATPETGGKENGVKELQTSDRSPECQHSNNGSNRYSKTLPSLPTRQKNNRGCMDKTQGLPIQALGKAIAT